MNSLIWYYLVFIWGILLGMWVRQWIYNKKEKEVIDKLIETTKQNFQDIAEAEKDVKEGRVMSIEQAINSLKNDPDCDHK